MEDQKYNARHWFGLMTNEKFNVYEMRLVKHIKNYNKKPRIHELCIGMYWHVMACIDMY